MHKSALTFGLLASSLVMLAVIPFLNQNNSFSNVMAQEYDKYGDSSCSTYQTEDKKYECRTSPFEGFFVGSVEFCKFKFDDNKRDNKTGTQGQPGLTGPFYQEFSPNVVFNQSAIGHAEAQCDPGDYAISGSGLFFALSTNNIHRTVDFQSTTSNNTWIAEMGFTGEGLSTLSASVICLDNPPLR